MGAYLSKSNQSEPTSDRTSKPSPNIFQQNSSIEDFEQDTGIDFNCGDSSVCTTTQGEDVSVSASTANSVQHESVNLDFDVENSLSGQSTDDEGTVDSNDDALHGLVITVDHLPRRRPEGMIVAFLLSPASQWVAKTHAVSFAYR